MESRPDILKSSRSKPFQSFFSFAFAASIRAQKHALKSKQDKVKTYFIYEILFQKKLLSARIIKI